MPPGTATVATLLERAVQLRLDAAAGGRFDTVHARTLPEALRAVRERPVQAVLVSPRLVAEQELSAVSSLVNGYPGVATIAVVAGPEDGIGVVPQTYFVPVEARGEIIKTNNPYKYCQKND